MEKESERYFATERDFSALAQDARSGAARSIGLSANYALVDLADGNRYYVRVDAQRPLVADILKEKLVAPAPAVFTLSEVHPPASPIHSAVRRLNNPSLL